MSAYERYDNAAGAKRWSYAKRVTLTDGTKTRVRGTPAINTKAAALEAERTHVERVLNPAPVVAPAAVRHRMTDVLDRFLTDYVTIANNKGSERATKTSAIERYIRPAFVELYIDEITAEKVEAFTAKLRRTASARKDENGDPGLLGVKYVNNILQTLRKCLRWAHKLKWLTEVPEIDFSKVDTEGYRYLEPDELDALCAPLPP